MVDEPVLKLATDATQPQPQPPPPARTSRQTETDLIVARIKDEIRRDFPELKSEYNDPDLRLVNRDRKNQLWLVICKNDRDATTNDRLIKSVIWNGSEIDTFDYFNNGIREYLALAKARESASFVRQLISPLTIGAMIGVLLVIITAVQLFREGMEQVPAQLWTILTAVIAFYFGRGGVRTDRDGAGE